ncbi:MAG: hypothetical protein K6E75_10540 [Lachnospiraceae bacterium]|nr:hypothetical protein [Lachnospiraceae bacterium]
MAENVAEQKCPNCDGVMHYDPEKKLLVCEYCGTEMDIKKATASKPKEIAEGFDFASLNDQATDINAQALPVYNCESCAAELIAPPEQMALTCPYCGNNIVLTDKASGALRPNAVIPFQFDKQKLPEAVRKFCKPRVLLPKDFFSDEKLNNLTGVYVPFWVFSGKVSGQMRYLGTKSSSYRSGDYMIHEHSEYDVVRDVDMSFDALPVDASGKIDDKLMDSLEPFHTNEAVPFDMRYLAGFTADRFDEKKGSIAQRAKKRMFSTAYSLTEKQAGAGYSRIKKNGGTLRTDIDAKYMLLPVYLFDLSHNGKTYHFAVNGQTGKIVGDVPIDAGRSAKFFFIRCGIVFGVLMIWFWTKYLCGY